MTAAFLQSELSNLIADSKKKHNDVRTSAEKSLADLKAISVTSETQLAGDLLRRPAFIDPLVLACQSRNAKLVTTATACLQRLIASHAVARDRLKDVLQAFKHVIGTGYEVQLKILQTLPALLQLYATEIHGELLARVLEVCATLQLSKTPLVSGTANATFQQLVTTVFEQASDSNERHSQKSDAVEDGDGEMNRDDCITTNTDAELLFDDFCALLNRSSPKFLQIDNLPLMSLVQIMESIFEKHYSFIKSHQNLLETCRNQLVPGLLRALTSKDDFGVITYALRTSFLLLRKFSVELQNELQQVLPYLVSALDRDASPLWKRVLCLEFFRSLCSDFTLLRQTFVLFDEDSESTNVVSKLMASMVRLAAEDPVLIGLGRQSTMPVQRENDSREDEMALIEAQGVGGGLASVNSADASVTGISIEWSVLQAPLIDMPDVAHLPTIPSTYLYALILGCISAFADGLSKYLMPLSLSTRRDTADVIVGSAEGESEVSAPEETPFEVRRSTVPGQKYQRLTNPLTITTHPHLPQIRTCANLIDSCWPAILATCSTFLNAALDTHFYHQLIRSAQKLAQVSGTLELSTPRDALLTSLAKSSVPANAAGVIAAAYSANFVTKASDGEAANDASIDFKSPVQEISRQSVDLGRQTLNIRNLLCLRALLNLGIALGPTLDQAAWFIVIETMQQVEALISIPSTSRANSTATTPRIGVNSQETQTTLGAEMTAVNTAMKRMFESTRSYSDDAFACVVDALFKLMGQPRPNESDHVQKEAGRPAGSVAMPVVERRSHHASRSVSGLWNKTKSLDIEIAFVLAKIGDLARINLHRFASISSQSSSWDLVLTTLLKISANIHMNEELRLRAASLIDLIAMETVKQLDPRSLSVDDINSLQCICLKALIVQVNANRAGSYVEDRDGIELEMHKRALEALEDILSHCGESLKDGWVLVFQLLTLTFRDTDNAFPKRQGNGSMEIASVAFRCVQLVAADFLPILNSQSLGQLTSLMFEFGTQKADVNMALTTTTLLRSVTSLVRERLDAFDLHDDIEAPPAQRGQGNAFGQDSNVQIWSMALKQLIRMCEDRRRDVRDATGRVLLQVLEAASDQFTPHSWQVALKMGPFSILQSYQSTIRAGNADTASYLISSTELTEGTANMIAENIQAIASDNSFAATWTMWIDIIRNMLEDSSLAVSELAFSNMSKSINALSQTKRTGAGFITPALEIWARQTTQREKERSGFQQNWTNPNQASLKSRARMLIEAYKTSPNAVRGFTYADKDIVGHLMSSIEDTVLPATHPPYTSDVKKLSSEQDEAIEMLSILKTFLRDRVEVFTKFVLGLLRATLSIGDGHENFSPDSTATSKKVQMPTFIAFASALIGVLRSLVEVNQVDANFLVDLQVAESLDVLSAIISTKYRNLPLNPEAPLWRTATSTAVAMLEAARGYNQQMRDAEQKVLLDNLGRSIILCSSNILGPGGLESKFPHPIDEVVLADEAFDIEHFQRFHPAAIPLICKSQVLEDTRKQYILTLFSASLLANPWYFDFPDDLLNSPLENLNTIRPGTVHRHMFHKRRKICYAALEALFNLVSDQDDPKTDSLAQFTAPYFLLRIAHPLKTFLADQRLRSLTPHPMPQQQEMLAALEKCLVLKSDDAALAHALGHQPIEEKGDGKTHLRALYPLVLKVQRYWRDMPQLKGDMAWQADTPGKEIQMALERWVEVVGEGEGWGVKM